MNRRQMMTFSAATGCMMAGAANAEGRQGPTLGDHRPVRVRLATGAFVTLSAVLATDGAQAMGVSWNGGAAVFSEQRFDLSRFAGFFRQPFDARWAAARSVGYAQAVGQQLVLRVDDISGLSGQRVTLAAGALSWDVPGTLRSQAIGGMLTDERASMGGVRQERDGGLLVQLNATAAI